MRTTINLEDDAYAVARAYARSRELRLGQAVSELVRRGSAGPLPLKEKGGVWMADLPAGTRRVTAGDVRDGLSDFP